MGEIGRKCIICQIEREHCLTENRELASIDNHTTLSLCSLVELVD